MTGSDGTKTTGPGTGDDPPPDKRFPAAPEAFPVIERATLAAVAAAVVLAGPPIGAVAAPGSAIDGERRYGLGGTAATIAAPHPVADGPGRTAAGDGTTEATPDDELRFDRGGGPARGSLPAAVASVGEGIRRGTTAATAASTAAATIRIEKTLRLTPDRPGSVRVRIAYRIPDGVSDLRTYLPDRVAVVATDGFVRESAGVYARATDGNRASVTVRIAANRTGGGRRELGGRRLRTDGGTGTGYVFVDVGPWAIVPVPQVGTRWREESGTDAVVESTASVAGEGATGDEIAYLGPHREYGREAVGQRFRLVVPAAADLRAPPAAILDALAAAAGRLRVGDRDDEVFFVAAPATVAWGPAGLQYGDDDAWVRADVPLDRVATTWLHEYVHTRQDFRTSAATRWVVEGSAEYYAGLSSLTQGLVDFPAFRGFLARGTESPYADAVLADPATWRVANYLKGALVVGALDRRIRLSGDRSFQNVVRTLNERSGNVTQAAFLAAVAAGDDSLRTAAERFTETGAVPEVWSAREHARAFDGLPAIFAYRDASARIEGPYRDAPVAGNRVVLAVGERLAVTATVHNVGEEAGRYEATLRVDDRAVATEAGRLGAGETTTVTLTRTFDDPGSYEVSLGDYAVTVVVRRPAEGTVEATVDVSNGGETTIAATVRADEVPVERTLAFVVDGEVVATRTVRLAPGESRTVRVRVTLSAGTHRVGIDGVGVETVEVGGTSTTADGEEGSGGATPGFGAALVVLAAVIVVAVLWRRSG